MFSHSVCYKLDVIIVICFYFYFMYAIIWFQCYARLYFLPPDYYLLQVYIDFVTVISSIALSVGGSSV